MMRHGREHFLTVAIYVERYALRLNLVKPAQQWYWSSLLAVCAGEWEGICLFNEWPMEGPKDWIELVTNRERSGVR
jgi:hypothetical protein